MAFIDRPSCPPHLRAPSHLHPCRAFHHAQKPDPAACQRFRKRLPVDLRLDLSICNTVALRRSKWHRYRRNLALIAQPYSTGPQTGPTKVARFRGTNFTSSERIASGVAKCIRLCPRSSLGPPSPPNAAAQIALCPGAPLCACSSSRTSSGLRIARAHTVAKAQLA